MRQRWEAPAHADREPSPEEYADMAVPEDPDTESFVAGDR